MAKTENINGFGIGLKRALIELDNLTAANACLELQKREIESAISANFSKINDMRSSVVATWRQINVGRLPKTPINHVRIGPDRLASITPDGSGFLTFSEMSEP